METLARDVTYAIRLLRRNPGFTAAVVLSLGLGIGANTAIFTLLDAVLWRMLPIRDPEQLLVVGRQYGTEVGTGFNYSTYRLLKENSSVAEVEGYTTAPINISIDGPPEPAVQGQLVSGGYFALLGVTPVVGRSIGPDDDRVPNGHPVVMFSHGYWERRFARDPAVVGRTIRLSAPPFTIIGVTPPDFFGVEIGTAPDLFMPLMMQPTVMPAFENLLDQPIVRRSWIQAIARTKADRQPRAGRRRHGRGDAEGAGPAIAPCAGQGRGAPPSRIVLMPRHGVDRYAGSSRSPCSFCSRWSAWFF